MDFDALFNRLYPALHRYVNRLTGDPDTADDIAQEAFVRLLRQSIPEDEAKPWLFTVATNLVRDRMRKTARQKLLLSASPVFPTRLPRPDEEAAREERVASVRAALELIPERDRQILLMREEGFKYEEIARATGVAPGSVGTLIARALKRFTKAYSSIDAGDDARR